MNILILSWRSPGHPNAGGAEQATFEHAKAWAKRGHDVVWFSSYFPGSEKNEVISSVRIIRRGGQVLGVKIAAFIWYLIGKHVKFDLVIDEFHGIPFFTPLYVRCVKLGFIHEVTKEVWRLNPWPKPLNLIPSFIGVLFEPLIFKVVYRNTPFMTVSESTKSDLENWGINKKNITVVHNGVSLDFPEKLPDKESKFTAVYLGAVSKDKGIFDAIKVFAEIDRKDEDWQYWVIGKGAPDINKKVKNLVDELGISGKTKFWGYVSDKKKFELLTKAHVLINPSVREGWCLVNIEANASGTPVVGYRTAGIKDSVKEGVTGILVEIGDYRSLAENALKLVKDRKKYLVFQQNARKWSNKFTWEKATKESLELIESL